MRTILFFLIFFFFVGCSQNTPQTPASTKTVQTVSQDKEFDELDRIDAKFKDELSPGTNAMKQINSMACPIK